MNSTPKPAAPAGASSTTYGLSEKPAAAPKKTSREMTITNFKKRVQNTLRGFFSMSLPSGMIIHDFMLHEKDGSRWVNPPSRPKDAAGEERYPPLVEFTNQEIKKRFYDDALAALDHYFQVMETRL